MAINVTNEVQGDTLVIKIKLNAPTAMSKTGKSELLATTGGFQPVAITKDGKAVKVSLNAIV